eukprot:CAMPEP_0198682450 /NCGR_PEP_ID=MMETSP1468-20131203/8723_1 /TAXON_ID=1461545 /ORGANISM="Mantoniella sp, Strain CCMP1436" /LENGTH=244 /DNA_ID=CAMNT_0044425389 /DNA_START=254 /DNA_END=985 /DNA_ORIENTATION=+
MTSCLSRFNTWMPCHARALRSGGTRRLQEQRAAGWRWNVAVASVSRDDGVPHAFLTLSPGVSQALSSGRVRPETVLLCGEGDFSFARALATSVSLCANPMRITATSFETVEEITSSWGGASNLDDLFQDSFVEVLHGVDATALDETFGKNRKWDKICFMFPHITGKGRISLNRQLLAGFFGAATQALSPGGTVEVALVAGQGGTVADGEAQRDFGNSWQVVTQAAKGNARLVLCQTKTFDASAW